MQLILRRKRAEYLRKKHSNIWPITIGSETKPPNWLGWPEKKSFALAIMHDVDTLMGQERCLQLAKCDEELGLRSIFYFVPERYPLDISIHQKLRARGFDIGVHGLRHDGKLFKSRKIFEANAKKINHYLHDWNCRGFSSPSMFHRLEWMHLLDIDWATSTFDTDPFEPQPEGMQTIFPFLVSHPERKSSYIELPYTLPQDITLFIILRESDNSIWKQKLDWIARNGGLALINTHPDYMNFTGGTCSYQEYPAGLYLDFLSYVKTTYREKYWHVLPETVARFWKKNVVK